MIGMKVKGWRLKQHIGKDGVADVYRAENGYGASAEVSVLPVNLSSSSTLLRGLEEMLKRRLRLHHPNLAGIDDYCIEPEYVATVRHLGRHWGSGATLRDYMVARPRAPLTYEILFTQLVPVASVLSTLHAEGLAHLHLDLDHVLIAPDLDWREVKVIDRVLPALSLFDTILKDLDAEEVDARAVSDIIASLWPNRTQPSKLDALRERLDGAPPENEDRRTVDCWDILEASNLDNPIIFYTWRTATAEGCPFDPIEVDETIIGNESFVSFGWASAVMAVNLEQGACAWLEVARNLPGYTTPYLKAAHAWEQLGRWNDSATVYWSVLSHTGYYARRVRKAVLVRLLAIYERFLIDPVKQFEAAAQLVVLDPHSKDNLDRLEQKIAQLRSLRLSPAD